MIVSEIFKSIQGEGSFQGYPCSFVRVSGCNLDCAYCDTKYSKDEGFEISLEKIVERVKSHKTAIVEITGGEPLMSEETPALAKMLLDETLTVLVETNGSFPIDILPEKVIKIMDIKCPKSGEEESFLRGNLKFLTKKDDIKFVISDSDDFSWALETVKKNNLTEISNVIFSPVFNQFDLRDFARSLMESDENIKLQVQLHKIIWGENTRGV